MNKEQRIAIATAFAEKALAGYIPKDAKLLGKGAFARVYEVAGLAVKVQRRAERDSWWGLSMRSQAGQVLESIFYRQIESPHFPKVYAFMGDSTEKWAAVMEKLHKVTAQPRITTKAVEYAARKAMDGQYGNPDWFADNWKTVRLPASQKAGIMAATRQLAAAGFIVSDVHGGNVMRRRSRIVLTDVVI